MASYIEPIRFALIVFPFLALAISAIFFIYEYRKYGTFLLTRAVILYSFVFYLLCAYFLVILPLPTKEAVAQMTGPKMELHLFASWENFRANTVLVLSDPSTYLPAMRQSVFRAIIQCLFTFTVWHLFKVLFPTVLCQNGLCKFLPLSIF